MLKISACTVIVRQISQLKSLAVIYLTIQLTQSFNERRVSLRASGLDIQIKTVNRNVSKRSSLACPSSKHVPQILRHLLALGFVAYSIGPGCASQR